MSEAAKQEAVTRSLVRKLSEVMGHVDRIAKNGRNDHFNYDFATESDIAAAVRKEMADRHLLLVPTVEKTEWEKVARRNGETKLCTLTVRYRLMDGDSGEEMEFTVLGQGEDSLDKATYKAMTGATKYALLKLFLIPTGDDPEKSSDSEHRHVPDNGRKTASAPAPKTTSKGAHPGASMAIKYGEGKGKTVGELTDAELAWQLDAADKAVRANDPKWHKANLAKQAALQAEAQVRISATGSGHIKAPANTSPKQAELPVEDEGEEIVTPQQRFFRLAQSTGLGGARLTSRAQGVLGKTANYTHADIDTLEASLKAVPA